MAEYIEREAVIAEADYDGNFRLIVPVKKIRNIPAADVVERKHGKWVEKPFLLGTTNECSLCGNYYGMPHGKFNFCPNCGADMRGGTR